MLLDFFPSRTLTWYLAKTFVTRILAVLVMLVLVLMMLDLLTTTADILAFPGNGEAELLRYVGLRVPQLVARFLPYSVLLATIITLATFNQNSEVVAMKAAGLSAHQILAPLLLAAGLVSLASFAFYERDPKGMIQRELRSDSATWADPGWRLAAPTIFDVRTAKASRSAAPVVVARELSPEQVALGKVSADTQPLTQLSRSIEALDREGRRTAELKGKWWHKISGPLSAFLMPLLGAVAGFGLARSGFLLARAVIGMALGFAYFVVDNAALAMGSFGGYPPLLAAWAPFLLFLLVGETVLIRTEE